jgi:hypothetical protein
MEQHLFCALSGDSSIRSTQLQWDRNIGGYAPPRQEQISLWHIPEVAGSLALHLAIQPNLSLLWIEQSSHHIEQRTLSATRGPDQRNEFPGIHVQRNVPERLDLVTVASEGHVYIP